VLVHQQSYSALAERGGEVRGVGDARGASEALREQRRQGTDELGRPGHDRLAGSHWTSTGPS
jgi:hypothetical protein